MANMANEALDRATGTTHEFKSKARTAEEQIQKIAHDAGERVGAVGSNLVHTTKEYVNNGREYVKEHPGKTVAMAAGIGFLAGSLAAYLIQRK